MAALSTVAATSKGINLLNYRVGASSSLCTTNAQNLHSQWLGTPIKISLQSNNFKPFLTTHCAIKAAVSFSLPYGKSEAAVSIEKIPKWSSKAIKSFAMGELEARKLKYSTTGTEALLMGILIEGTNFASKYLRTNSITLFKVREETVKILGKADMWFFSPEHPPLTEDAQKALDWALDEKLKSSDNGEITTTHLLLGVWSQVGSPGYKILSGLGFNDEKAQELKNVISEPGFVDD
ncbi:PREDICTED: ATP-dependent Clp protease ATP-binding subunit CLPT2, chloroplastic-like [Nicotiana attenuata]|uniref:Atp-dependent clp protease atp-binding subunit clpt2, chloroplastic n=1 Tax=Nicotiana attenuata TaxID=49451 RepID=A0A1J6I5K1_NICAT|nr:PREDICTED: ATP-dependent Clp protease ATP-binding subunit CLPT2, chloroplastic-like [Nicotiana attenuata]OIS99747.1 atp-dependent clp protease atp-binding subunit clpt2, chloroplastic [Nicotiana attenuata]